ncbi:MAG TPA: SRPBCC domain-containing protein [Candidatus Limnocylindrales bacterium]|nr:SRPBCC domain-containing protein [Candidatus Limnocylindrales bacterium]
MTDDPMAPAFRALSDPSRRLLLDRLFERDGQTLGELCAHLPQMTRFGVMRHLGVLEEADLVMIRREGREKRHFLNPVPIRLLHDRWIGKFAGPVIGTMAAMKHALEANTMSAPDHVYSVFIKAAPDRVWRAITDGVETEQYYYGTRVDSDWSPGGRIVYGYPDGSVAADGEVIEIEPGRRVTMTFHAHWDPEIEREGPVRMAWEIEPAGEGVSKLTVTTSGMGEKTAASFTGGMVHIVSGLKTYLETGAPMTVAAG